MGRCLILSRSRYFFNPRSVRVWFSDTPTISSLFTVHAAEADLSNHRHVIYVRHQILRYIHLAGCIQVVINRCNCLLSSYRHLAMWHVLSMTRRQLYIPRLLWQWTVLGERSCLLSFNIGETETALCILMVHFQSTLGKLWLIIGSYCICPIYYLVQSLLLGWPTCTSNLVCTTQFSMKNPATEKPAGKTHAQPIRCDILISPYKLTYRLEKYLAT